jgi:RHS repeat-associated protein
MQVFLLTKSGYITFSPNKRQKHQQQNTQNLPKFLYLYPMQRGEKTHKKAAAFGMLAPGRVFNSGEYSWGVTGLEKDDEISGAGNTFATEFRQYNSRIGRWWSIDKLANKFPHYSPYMYASNRPIVAVDLDGLEDMWIHYTEQKGGSHVKTIEAFELSKETNRDMSSFMGVELPSDGAVTTVKRTSGTYEINSYVPTHTVSAEKPQTSSYSNSSISHKISAFEGGIRGNTYGELEGEKGLRKTNKAYNDVGTSLLLTPLSPIGESLIIASGIIDTGLDFKNKSAEEAGVNLFIRVTTFGTGKALSGVADKMIKNSLEKRMFEFGSSVALDKVKEKSIEINSEIKKDSD